MRRWFDPFEELKRLQSRIDDLFGEIEGKKGLLPAEMRDFPVDVVDEADKVKVVAELPGFKKEDIETAIEDSYLIIRAEKTEETEEKEKDYIRRERRYGEFRRRIQIPTDVNMEQISATYKNGVLEVTLPKAEPAKKKRINIQ
ncbi:MAG: Hsp20/alpha crystallin family protein [Archaeoglobaceae archaeon]